MKQFLRDIKTTPLRLLTDFDNKLTKGDVEELLINKGIDIAASPSGRQHQNGLVKGNWKHMVQMARDYLANSLMPTKFWYFALPASSGNI